MLEKASRVRVNPADETIGDGGLAVRFLLSLIHI